MCELTDPDVSLPGSWIGSVAALPHIHRQIYLRIQCITAVVECLVFSLHSFDIFFQTDRDSSGTWSPIAFIAKVSIVHIDIDLLSAATPFNFYRLASATVLRFYLRHKINVCQHNYCHLIKVVMLRRIRFFVMPNGYLVHFPHDTAPGSPPELNR